MNSIVERLRGFKSAAAQAWSQEAADLIEQQAERIKELEAKVESATNAAIDWYEKYDKLRQRIDDAKVVQKSKRQLLSRVEELSLIVKEDLL